MEKIEQLIKETTNNLMLHLDHKPGDRKFIEGTLENFKNVVLKKLFATIRENRDSSGQISIYKISDIFLEETKVDLKNWEQIGVNMFLDGNMWCATYPDFTNLQESPAGFGVTQDDAYQDLIQNN